MRALALTLLAACAGAAEPERLAASPLEVAASITRAADNLIRGWQPDYAHPITSTDDTFARATALYTSACELGDRTACWHGGITGAILDNCLAGDAPSCRYYGDWPRMTAPLPGRAARAFRSGDHAVAAADLRRECELGLARSCQVYVARAPDAADARFVAARGIELADEGCRAGLASDCHVLVDLHVPGSRHLAAIEDCIWRADCGRLAAEDETTRDPFDEVIVRERGCQLTGDRWRCLDLARKYLHDDLPEPVPGRGQQLWAWACPSQLGPGCR